MFKKDGCDCTNCEAKDACEMFNKIIDKVSDETKVTVEVMKIDKEAVKFFNLGSKYAAKVIVKTVEEGIKDKECNFENFEGFETALYNGFGHMNIKEVASAITMLMEKGIK